MKYFHVVVASVLICGQASANDLGLPESVVAALSGKSTTCAKIRQTGEQISYAYAEGFHVAKSGTKLIRFFTANSALPFTGNAIISQNGSISRQVVDVEACQQSVAARPVEKPADVVPVVARRHSVPKEEVVQSVMEVKQYKSVETSAPVPTTTKTVAEKPSPIMPIAVASPEKGSRKVAKGDTADGSDGSVFDNLDSKVTLSHMESMGGSDKKRSGNSVTVEGTYFQPAWNGKGRVGMHATYTKGDSDSVNRQNGRETKTDYWKVGGGVVSQYEFARNTDFIVEADLLYQDTKGFTPAKNFRSHQTEWQMDLDLSVASDDNRQNGILWMPYWEVGARAIKSFGVDYSDSKGTNDWYDNSRYSIYGDMDIYDFYGGNWRLTPNVGLEGGYMVGKSAAFIEPGISTKLAYAGKEIFETGFDWRFMSGDNRWYWFGTIRPVAIGRILWAQKTTDYTSPRD